MLLSPFVIGGCCVSIVEMACLKMGLRPVLVLVPRRTRAHCKPATWTADAVRAATLESCTE
jgi:hypothetical protein